MATKTEQSILDREKRSRAAQKARQRDQREAVREAKADSKAHAEKVKQD